MPSSTDASELTPKPAGNTATTATASLELEQLASGNTWRGYAVRDVLPDITYGKCFSATEVATGSPVVIRSFRVNDDARAHVWSQFFEYKEEGVLAALAAFEVDGRRVEVTRAPDCPNLLEYFSGRKATTDEVRWLVRELLRIVSGLHARNLVHLNLKPATLFVQSVGYERHLLVGGFETLLDVRREGMATISIDAFYAPPEVAGLFQHPCSPTLRAWDWWTVGRVLQEAVLGTHVLGVLLDRDMSRRTPELQVRADQFLREKDIAVARPGGVELMRDVTPQLIPLFRGLLASCRDARWGGREIDRWLKGEQVRERYHLSRQERLYVWNDVSYSIPEAAELFNQPDQWPGAVAQIFDAEKPALLSFLLVDGNTRKLGERIRELTRLPETSAFEKIPIHAVREIITAISLVIISGGTIPLRWRGAAVDTELLRHLLSDKAQPDGLSVLESLMEPALTQVIAQVDPTAGRLTNEFSRLATQAATIAAEHRWIARANRQDLLQLYRCVWETEPALRERLKSGRERFAASRDTSLNKLFQAETLDHSDLALLAFALQHPDRFLFVDHATWSAEQYKILREKGERLAIQGSWFNLAKLIRTAPYLFGPLPIVALCWAGLAAGVALVAPSRSTLGLAVATFIGGFAMRFFLCALCRSIVASRLGADTATPKVSLRNCLGERASILKRAEGVDGRENRCALEEVNRHVETLHDPKRFPEIKPPAHFRTAQWGAVGTLALMLGIGSFVAYRVTQHPPSLQELKTAWLHPVQVPPPSSEETNTARDAAAAKETKPKPEQKMSWTYRAPPEAQKVRVLNTTEASGEQARAARDEGKAESAPYRAETINALIAVKVPAENGVGLMLYDGRSGKLVDRRVFTIGYVPLPRSWIEVAEKQAIFLGSEEE